MNRSRQLIPAAILVLLAACASGPSEDQLAVTRSDTETPIFAAARAGDLNALKAEVKAGAGINVEGPEGTPLQVAAMAGADKGVMQLLQMGADPNAGTDGSRQSVLQIYAARGNVTLIRGLLRAGAALEYRDQSGRSALAYALAKGNLPAAKLLIKAGSDINSRYDGRSLLMHAVDANSLLMAQLLIDSGVDVAYQNPQGESAMSIAQTRNLGDLQMLLRQSGSGDYN